MGLIAFKNELQNAHFVHLQVSIILGIEQSTLIIDFNRLIETVSK